MQACQDAIHVVVDCSTLGIPNLRYSGVPENAPLQVLHHVEHGADNGFVLAKGDRLWNRDIGVL